MSFFTPAWMLDGMNEKGKMTPERWDYLKHLKPSNGRWLVIHTQPNRKERRNVPAIPGRANGSVKRPKTLEEMLNLSKRQARKMRKRVNNYVRALSFNGLVG